MDVDVRRNLALQHALDSVRGWGAFSAAQIVERARAFDAFLSGLDGGGAWVSVGSGQRDTPAGGQLASGGAHPGDSVEAAPAAPAGHAQFCRYDEASRRLVIDLPTGLTMIGSVWQSTWSPSEASTLAAELAAALEHARVHLRGAK